MKQFHHIDKKFLIRSWIVLWAMILLQLWLSKLIGEEVIRGWVEQAWIRGPIILILYKTFSVVIAPLSWSVMYLIAWWLFGVRWWVVYGAIGNFLGMSLAYWIGYRYGEQAVGWLIGKNAMQEITHLTSHLHDKKTFIVTRCVLLPLEDLINFASGMVRVPYLWFIVSSMIIVTALSSLIIFFGDLVM